MLFPTATTHPAGTWTISSTEIVLEQITYSPTDTTQITGTFTPFLTAEVIPFDMTLKSVFSKVEKVRLAALASIGGLMGHGLGFTGIGRFGAVAQFCWDEGCRSSVNLSTSAVMLGAPIFANSAGAVWDLGGLTKLLLETEMIFPPGQDMGDYNGLAITPGVRWSRRAWAIDLSLLIPVTVDEADLPALPILTGTYRFLD